MFLLDYRLLKAFISRAIFLKISVLLYTFRSVAEKQAQDDLSKVHKRNSSTGRCGKCTLCPRAEWNQINELLGQWKTTDRLAVIEVYFCSCLYGEGIISGKYCFSAHSTGKFQKIHGHEVQFLKLTFVWIIRFLFLTAEEKRCIYIYLGLSSILEFYFFFMSCRYSARRVLIARLAIFYEGYELQTRIEFGAEISGATWYIINTSDTCKDLYSPCVRRPAGGNY